MIDQLDNENDDHADDLHDDILPCDPQSFIVEGPLPEEGKETTVKKRKISERKETISKKARNNGDPYFSAGSGQAKPARRILGPACVEASKCEQRKLCCKQIGTEQRKRILNRYYDLPSLDEKRKFIHAHVTSGTPVKKNGERRDRTLFYSLTLDGSQLRVCKTFFLSTLGISERQVQTMVKKTDGDGILDVERRGGRSGERGIMDGKLNDAIRAHIDNFPRVESHYCRKDSSKMFLAPDLTLGLMYEMYMQSEDRMLIKQILLGFQKNEFQFPQTSQRLV